MKGSWSHLTATMTPLRSDPEPLTGQQTMLVTPSTSMASTVESNRESAPAFVIRIAWHLLATVHVMLIESSIRMSC